IASNSEIAHSRWVSTKDTDVPELEMMTRPRAKQGYMYDGYTKPEYCGRGIDGAVRNFIYQTMKCQGVENIYSYVRNDNPVGIRAARRWQARIGTVWYLRFSDADPLVFGRDNAGMPLLIRKS